MVVDCGDQMFDVEFCWISNFGVTVELVAEDEDAEEEDDEEEEAVTNGWTKVKRFLPMNDVVLLFG